jgi:hypothetical protein
MSVLKDETVQKHGVVLLWDMMSEYSEGYDDFEAYRLATRTACAIPVRLVARYLLYESEKWNHVIDVLNRFISPHARARTRGLNGPRRNVMYSLGCLGIPYHCMPVDGNGNINLTTLNAWIETRQNAELPESKRKELVPSPWYDTTEASTGNDPVSKRRKKLCSTS